MLITRKSPVTKRETTMDIPVTEEQLKAWEAGTPIQRAMPHLSADQREFIMTGMTAQDWERTFG